MEITGKLFYATSCGGHESASLVEVIREILLGSCVTLAGSILKKQKVALGVSVTVEALREFARGKSGQGSFLQRRVSAPPPLSLAASWQVALGGLAESSAR